ncbi:MAG: hypothetical protein ABR540_11660 [Acidimicrobiales bacterium]
MAEGDGMNQSGADRSTAGASGWKPPSPWWAVGALLLLFLALPADAAPSGASASPPTAAIRSVAHDVARARICDRLRRAQSTFGDNPAARQALAAVLARFGCTGTPPAVTTTSLPGNTTTTSHFDCPLPGGGVGPCPTTTTFLSTTTSGPTTTTTLPPGASTTVAPSTTVPRCPTSTTSTSSTTGTGPTTSTLPPTTIACVP